MLVIIVNFECPSGYDAEAIFRRKDKILRIVILRKNTVLIFISTESHDGVFP